MCHKVRGFHLSCGSRRRGQRKPSYIDTNQFDFSLIGCKSHSRVRLGQDLRVISDEGAKYEIVCLPTNNEKLLSEVKWTKLDYCFIAIRLFRTKVGHHSRHNDCNNYDQLAVCVRVASADSGQPRTGSSRCDWNGPAKLWGRSWEEQRNFLGSKTHSRFLPMPKWLL